MSQNWLPATVREIRRSENECPPSVERAKKTELAFGFALKRVQHM
jgi:hypothetical protein